MLAPVKVTIPAVVLFKGMLVPVRMAELEPLLMSKEPVLVRIPEVPVILPPPSRVMVPTLSLKVAILSSAVVPLMVTGPVLRALAIPYSIVPEEMVVEPVYVAATWMESLPPPWRMRF